MSDAFNDNKKNRANEVAAYQSRHSATRPRRLEGLRDWLRKLARLWTITTTADLWTILVWLRGKAHLARLAWDIFWFHALNDDEVIDLLERQARTWSEPLHRPAWQRSEGLWPYNPLDRDLYLASTKPWCPRGEDTAPVPVVA